MRNHYKRKIIHIGVISLCSMMVLCGCEIQDDEDVVNQYIYENSTKENNSAPMDTNEEFVNNVNAQEIVTTKAERIEVETPSKGENSMELDLSKITINTQSSIRIAGSKNLYFDAISIDKGLKDADIVFVTHEHYDHFEIASMNAISNDKTIFVAPLSMKDQILKGGINEEKCIFLEPDDTTEIGDIKVSAVAAYNELKPFHPKSKKWLGYVVNMDGVSYYVAGDTDANEDVRKVRCDIALIPIGGTYTMDYKAAAEYILSEKPCKVVVPTHFGSIVGNALDGQNFKNEIESKASDIKVCLILN